MLILGNSIVIPTYDRSNPVVGDAGVLIRTAREQKGWTQLELATRAHVSVPTVANAENPDWAARRGGALLKRGTLIKIGNALGLDEGVVSREWEKIRELHNAPAMKERHAPEPAPQLADAAKEIALVEGVVERVVGRVIEGMSREEFRELAQEIVREMAAGRAKGTPRPTRQAAHKPGRKGNVKRDGGS